MNAIKVAAIIVIVLSVMIGGAFGLLIPSDQPPNQVYRFSSFATHTSEPVSCYPNPKNYSNWLGIEVIGNRTGMNFQTVTVFSTGYNLRFDLPLNRTSFASYRSTNSSYETIFVALPDYFNPGDVIQISIGFFISGYAPVSLTLPETPILDGALAC